MAGPGDGLVVLDFSWGMAGGLATAVLADFGAEVIKIEPPKGDPFRGHPAWAAWNRGKRSIAVDLKTAEGRGQVQRLAAQADVALESFRPGVADRLEIGYAALSAINPQLVYASISGWGQQGPLSRIPGYEGAIAAKCGRMASFEGQMNRAGPTYAAVQVGTWAASQAAVRGILAALLARDSNGGRGQWVQTSLLQNMIPYDLADLMMRQLSRLDPGTFPPGSLGARLRLPMLQYIPVRTKDGRWLQHANLMDRLFRAYLKAVGLGWVLEEELFKNAPIMNHESREALRELILTKMQERTLAEWMEVYMADGNIAAEPFHNAIDGIKHEQFVHNSHAIEIADPRVGTLTALGVLARLSDTPGEVGGPAPEIGQHNEEILQRGGRSQRFSQSLAEKNNGNIQYAGSPRPLLDGITLLDFSMVIAGPYAAAVLADMGARVIKVDATPEREQTISASGGLAPLNLKNYAGKEAIQVNLQSPAGQKIIHELIVRADVLLHNFRPGVPERLAIDWDTCRRLNPKLIHVYVGAYGATGPHHRRPGAHPIPGALLGGALRQAGRANPPPSSQPMNLEEIKETSRLLMRANEANPDPNTSQAVATSIMLALSARARSGRGQAVEVTMLQANAWANADEAYDYRGRPWCTLPDEQCYGLNALYRLYPASEGWVFLACVFEREWKAFCDVANCSVLLADPRFANVTARSKHDAELASEIGKVFVERSADTWEQLLTAAGVACVRADTDTGAFLETHPQAAANRMAVEVDSPRFGKYLRHGAIIDFSAAPARLEHGSFAGEHTKRVMQELGYSGAQIAELRARRVIHWEEVDRLATAR